AVLVDARKLQVTFRSARLNLKRVRFIARNLQIRCCFGMMPLQRERTLVIQNRAPKVARAEVSVAEIVKYVCAPLSGANQGLVARDRFLEMALGEFLVCFRKFGVGLRQ